MVRSSQLHKLNVHGQNSAGERRGFLKSLMQHGTDVINATVEVTGFYSNGDQATVVTDIGGGSVTSDYDVTGDENAVTVANGLALVINAQTDHTADNAGSVIQITKTTSGSVAIVSVDVGLT